MTPEIIAGYEKAAPRLIAQYGAISPETLYAPFLNLFPSPPYDALDIGAGVGRDANWLAKQGARVWAAEPTPALRAAGRALTGDAVCWLDDALPALEQARSLGRCFDLILLSGVWQHIDDTARERAISNIAQMVAPRGLVIISVRNGPGAPDRPCFTANAEDLIRWGELAGLKTACDIERESVQESNRAAGVSWRWIGLRMH